MKKKEEKRLYFIHDRFNLNYWFLAERKYNQNEITEWILYNFFAWTNQNAGDVFYVKFYVEKTKNII